MRDLIVPELRKRWPSARIIHELPLRYSTNRIDLAAVTRDEIISVEIKSSRDVIDRLEAQLRGFLPISSQVIVALAPKWNEKLPPLEEVTLHGKCWREQWTETQELIRRFQDGSIATWTVDVGANLVKETAGGYHKSRPWLTRMLHVLHVAELEAIAGRHGCWRGKRPVHDTLVAACTDMMTGHEIVAAVCAALRARDAFDKASDRPIVEAVAA